MGREYLQCVMGFHHMWLRIWESRAAHCLVYHTQTNPDSWEIGRHNQSSSNFYLLGIIVCDKQDQPAVWEEHTQRHAVIFSSTHTHTKRHIYTDRLIHITCTLTTAKQAISGTHCQWSVVFPALLTHIHDARAPSSPRPPSTNVQRRPLDVYSSANS